jgi:hypothetical protein
VAGPNGEKITFDVKFDIVTPQTQQAGLDTLTVKSGQGNSNVHINYNGQHDTGTIFTLDKELRGTAPHETGHLMGLLDAYKKNKKEGLDITGPAGDIMRYGHADNNARAAGVGNFDASRGVGGPGVLGPGNANVSITRSPIFVPPPFFPWFHP